MMRLLSAAFVATVVSGTAALGADTWRQPAEAGPDLIAFGGDPWADIFDCAAFDRNDAFVFGDVTRRAYLDDDAIAIAVKGDRDLLADAASETSSAIEPDRRSGGRVSSAFDRFVVVGSDGVAYASRGFGRDDAVAVDVVDAEPATASRVALNVSER